MSHPLDKLDIFLGIEKGVARDVMVKHNETHLPLLREKLAEQGITLLEDTSIPKKERVKWAELAQKAGLPMEWWMVEEEPQDFIPEL